MPIRLPKIISNNMVLQQGVNTRIWGWASPGEEITVNFQNQSVPAKTDSAGKWLAILSPLKPGGPFEMEVSGKDESIKIKNILVGEVWLASGQSNMEMRIKELKKCDKFSKNARFPKLRFFEAEKNPSFTPLDDVNGKWVECTPETVKEFSAVGYFFAKDILKGLKVPVGMIGSYWGGTRAEVWTDRKTLESLGGYEEDIAMSHVMTDAEKEKFNELWAKATNPPDPGNKGFGLGYASLDFDDSSWKFMEMPSYWEDKGYDMDGTVWFRKEINIPQNMAGKELDLSLGAVDDYDTTYFNGAQVGSTGRETPNWWAFPRNYKIPAEIVKPGKNVIAVRIFDIYDKGGMVGPAEKMYLSGQGKKIKLQGNWKFNIETIIERQYLKLKNPSSPQDFAMTLFNGMINPITPFNIKGVIWYQGESNDRRAKEYEALFKAMINCWRSAWQNPDMHFHFVQLTNFRCETNDPVENCGWAQVRESQLKTLELPNTGMAVTIDIGEVNDIHPQNKLDVGKRLAISALGKVYGKRKVYSGPIYSGVKFKNGRAEISFTHTGSGLKVKGGKKLKGFAVAGSDKKYEWAQAKIQGKKVIVWNNKIKKPAAVRYGWANNPPCNLYNREGLPASPFRTDN